MAMAHADVWRGATDVAVEKWDGAMTIDWTDDWADVDWQELEALYRAAPLGNKNADDLKVVFGNSMFCCFARHDGRLVGAGRVLADGRDCAYLCDVAVLPDYQGTGIGKQ